mgnify:CR=1 FL=1
MKNIKIILVEPIGPINIGSVARVCANFGVKELRLVAPQCDPNEISARKMALKGIKLLENALFFSTLLDAIQDCDRIIATCGRIDHGVIPLYSTKNALKWLVEGSLKEKVAIVFGREDRGLTNEELLLAQKVVSISTSPDYPSLNLSHAVAIVLYELTNIDYNKETKINNKLKNHKRASQKELNNYLQQSREFLLKIGFLYKHTANSRMSKIKGLLQRADIRSDELSLIRGILRQAQWFIDNKDN